MTPTRPVVLCILDGWGHRETREANAIQLGRTPVLDRLWQTCPHALIDASAQEVGLPAGQMGNSEVGHMNLGAGRIVMQDLPRIDAAIEQGELGRLPRHDDWRIAVSKHTFALIEAQVKTYPLDKCVVSGEPLDAMGGPLDVLYGTQLVRLCCKGCKKAFHKDAAAMVAKINAAAAKKPADKQGG